MKMNRICVVLVLITVAVSVSLGQAKGNKPPGNSVRDQIEAVSADFSKTLSKGDAAKIAGMYADDASVMPPNGALVTERTKIQDFWKGFIDSGARLSITTTGVEAQGNAAIEVGTFELVAPDGKRESGKFIVIWRRYKKDWKIAYDIWNNN